MCSFFFHYIFGRRGTAVFSKYSTKGIYEIVKICGRIFHERNIDVYCSVLSEPRRIKTGIESIRSIQDVKLRAKVYRSLKLLESYGNRLGEPDTKALGDGIFELRTKSGSNIVRTLYFYQGHKVIVVTNSFVKKTQKTPENEIETARKRKAYYEQNQKERT